MRAISWKDKNDQQLLKKDFAPRSWLGNLIDHRPGNIHTALCHCSIWKIRNSYRQRDLTYFNPVTANIHYLNILKTTCSHAIGKYQMNSLHNVHYLFKTTSTWNLNIYICGKQASFAIKLPTCTLQYMILLVEMGKRESIVGFISVTAVVDSCQNQTLE
jgi:hypothetical protein